MPIKCPECRAGNPVTAYPDGTRLHIRGGHVITCLETGTYEVAADGSWFRCLYCGMTSHNPNDAAQSYCGNCRMFHESGAPDSLE